VFFPVFSAAAPALMIFSVTPVAVQLLFDANASLLGAIIGVSRISLGFKHGTGIQM